MKRWSIGLGLAMTILAVSLIVGCTKSPGKSAAKASYTEDELSLRKGAMVGSVEELPAAQYSMKAPGEAGKLERGFYDAPPMIPHDMEAAGQNLEGNDCLDCHAETDEETPGIPASHKMEAKVKVVDTKMAKNGQVTYVAGFMLAAEGASQYRYNCNLCHAPQASNLKPLVENHFQTTTPKDGKADVLDQLNNFSFE